MKENSGKKTLWKRITSRTEFSIFIGLVVLCILMSFLSEYFLKVSNIFNILNQISRYGIVSVGMALVIIAGGIDLSVGYVVGLTASLCAYFSSAMALPWFLAGDLFWMLLPRGALCIILLVFVSTIIPYTLFTIGIRKIKLGTGYTLALSEPLTAWFLSTALLGERLSAVGVAGVGALFAGILLLALDKKAA